MLNITKIPAPRVELIDPNTGLVSREWFRFFNNIYTIVGANLGVIQIENGGTGLGTLPANGQLLIGDTTTGAYVLNTIATALGVSVTNGAGTITIANTGVLSTIAGTGISVSSATGDVTITNTGVISVSGTAPVVSSGGTTPAISMAAATTSVNGYLTSTDWTTFNNKGLGTVTSVSVVTANGMSGTVANPTTTPAITLNAPALANLSDVTLSTPLSSQVLGYNGAAWVNVAGASAGAGTGVVFYNATPIITASGTQNNVQINTLATIPVVTAEQTVTGSANAASGAVLFSAFVSAALNRTIIDAGVWDFTSWIGVDSNNLSNTVTRQVYTAIPFVTGTVTMTGTGTTRTATASAGTPFALAVIDASSVTTDASYLQTPSGLYQIITRTSDTVVTINNVPATYTNESAVAGTVWKKLFGVTTGEINDISPDYGLYDVAVTAASYAITTATKVGILGFFTSTTPVTLHTVTITYNGTTRNTHVNTPLANIHNDLAGLNGGAATEYYHSTLAEYTGTGTGVFVRATSPTLVTPALGTPTALVGTNITGTAAAFNINGTVGATTPTTGSFTTVAHSAGTTAIAPITLTSGTNLTAAVAGAAEYDGTNLYFTQDTTQGRGVVPTCQQFYRSSAGTAFGPTIGLFFGANSAISLDASSTYQIEAFCYFLKTTAGTATWTHTISSAATLAHAILEYTQISGFTTAIIVGAMLTTPATQQTSTALVHTVTGLLNPAVYHIAKFRIQIVTNAACNYRLNLTQSAGTVTPQAGSYYKVTRVGGTAGNFVA